jgi:hypothetical protein
MMTEAISTSETLISVCGDGGGGDDDDGVRLCLRTMATKEPIVHPPVDI